MIKKDSGSPVPKDRSEREARNFSRQEFYYICNKKPTGFLAHPEARYILATLDHMNSTGDTGIK
jgi:hypothetical protein